MAKNHQTENALFKALAKKYEADIAAGYATLLIYLGEPENALKQIERAKRIDPFCPDILFEDEGICFFWLKKYDSAIDCFNKLKVPTKNSLFYLTASLIKNDAGGDLILKSNFLSL